MLLLLLCGRDAFAFETWQVQERELRVDVTAYGKFAAKQYQHRGEPFDLLDQHSPGSYQQLGTLLGAEFGLFDKVALFVGTSFRSDTLRSEFGSAHVTGMSDFRLGGKWRAVDSSFTLTLAPELAFPTGYSASNGAMRPVLGDGVNQYTARVWLGKRFTGAPFYFELGTGYRLRGGRIPRGGGPRVNYSDEVPYDVEAGYWFTRSFAAHLFLDGVAGLSKPEALDRATLSPTMRSFTNVGGGLTYRINQLFRLHAQYRHTVMGINALRGQFAGLGVTLNYGI